MPKGIYLHQRIVTKDKICPTCNQSFSRKTKESIKQWEKKRYCSISCQAKVTTLGRPAWNKGKKWEDYLSPEAIKKCSTANLGNKHSAETKAKYSQDRMGEKNPLWKGDDVGYYGLHNWIRRKLGKPNKCENCGLTNLNPRQYHWANKSHKYKREISDWIRLCVKCHKKYDS